MSSKRTPVTLPRSERLRDSVRRATSMSLPLAVHRKLDLLAEEATDVSATRAEIIAMLIAEAEVDAASLEQRIVAYRKKKVGDVLPGPGQDPNVVVPLRPPGRPRHSAS